MILAILMFPQKFFCDLHLLSDMRAVQFFSSKLLEKISQTPEFI